MFAVFVCVLLIQAVFGERLINVNDQFTAGLDLLNKNMQPIYNSSYTGMKDLPQYELFNTESVIMGLDTLIRKSDAFLKFFDDGKSVSFDFSFGYRFIDFVFGKLVFDGQQMEAVVRLHDNTMHVNFTVLDKGVEETCRVQIDELQVQPFTWVILESSLPKYNGITITEKFNEEVRPKLNAKVGEIKNHLENFIYFPFCTNPRLNLEDKEILKVLFFHAANILSYFS